MESDCTTNFCKRYLSLVSRNLKADRLHLGGQDEHLSPIQCAFNAWLLHLRAKGQGQDRFISSCGAARVGLLEFLVTELRPSAVLTLPSEALCGGTPDRACLDERKTRVNSERHRQFGVRPGLYLVSASGQRPFRRLGWGTAAFDDHDPPLG